MIGTKNNSPKDGELNVRHENNSPKGCTAQNNSPKGWMGEELNGQQENNLPKTGEFNGRHENNLPKDGESNSKHENNSPKGWTVQK